jgi:hypothetical protein
VKRARALYTFGVYRSLALSLLLFTACSSNVGPNGLVIGGACRDDFDCAAGSFCLRGISYPQGTCTITCREDADCRGDSRCVEEGAGVCLLACDVSEDCGRESYTCAERDRAGEAARVMVCVGD